MDVSPFEPDQNAAETLCFGILVVISHDELGKRQDRLAPMVGERSGFPCLCTTFPFCLDGPSNGRGGWRAEPVPAEPSGSPPRFVQRDAKKMRLGEAE